MDGPVYADLLVRIGICKRPRKARERLTQLEKKKRLKCVGRVLMKKSGPPTHIYVARDSHYEPGNKLEHDVKVRVLCLLYWDFKPTMVSTGPERADARFVIGKHTYLIEFDNNTENETRLRERLSVYRQTPHNVLFIAEGDFRCTRILNLAKELQAPVFVGRFSTVVGDPFGKHFVGIDGQAWGITA
jgi:hypothetical protein